VATQCLLLAKKLNVEKHEKKLFFKKLFSLKCWFGKISIKILFWQLFMNECNFLFYLIIAIDGVFGKYMSFFLKTPPVVSQVFSFN
jgi:hypothetical protein